jgi:hypothetical protein
MFYIKKFYNAIVESNERSLRKKVAIDLQHEYKDMTLYEIEQMLEYRAKSTTNDNLHGWV